MTLSQRLAYSISGAGPWLVLLHALGSSRRLWEPLARALRGRFRLLAYDLRGHGESAVPRPPYTLDALAEDHCRLLDELNIARSHLCGIALGGEVAQLVAARWPERVATLSLADTVCHAERRELWDERIALARSRGMAALQSQLLPRWFSPAFAAREPQQVQAFAEELAQMDIDGFEGAARAVRSFDLRPLLPRVQCPATVLVGAQDSATPELKAREIVAAIAGARLAVIPDAGHFSAVEQPDRFAQQLLATCTAV